MSEKAYDMIWKEGLMIKLDMMGITAIIYNWIKDILADRFIQVRIGKVLSGRYMVENGIPQGSIISPILFSIMIKDVFSQVQGDIVRSLFADDRAVWKRGRNINHITRKIQEAIEVVEKWSYAWGFRFSVDKTKTITFTRKRGINTEVKIYGQTNEQVKVKFLGVWFDAKLTWNEHIQKIKIRQ